jgi:hypothetical protein
MTAASTDAPAFARGRERVNRVGSGARRAGRMTPSRTSRANRPSASSLTSVVLVFFMTSKWLLRRSNARCPTDAQQNRGLSLVSVVSVSLVSRCRLRSRLLTKLKQTNCFELERLAVTDTPSHQTSPRGYYPVSKVSENPGPAHSDPTHYSKSILIPTSQRETIQ